MRVACATDVGIMRKVNEDSCKSCMLSENSACIIVCDGMGGAKGGDIASSMAAESIFEFVKKNFEENLSAENVKNILINAINTSNDDLFSYSKDNSEIQGMGTTVVLMIATKGTLHVAHIGDSRGYIFTDEGLSQITMDHSYVQDLVNFGEITPSEAKVHPRRNIITRVLGVHESVKCDYNSFYFPVGSSAIACTDGLTNFADDSLILEYMKNQSGEELAKHLIDFANEMGGSDNITVAVINND